MAGIDGARQPAQVRRLIGLAGQFAAVEAAMTGRENLEMVGRSSASITGGRGRPPHLDQLQLTEDADRLVRTYSGGLRRRLTWAPAWSGRRACCCWTSQPPA